MDEEIRYTLSVVDNITPALARIESQLGKLTSAEQGATRKTTEQNVSFMAQVQALRSIDYGFRGVTNVLIETGIVGGKTARTMQTLGLAIHGVSSAFQLLKGARQILIMLQGAEIGVAGVETYRAGLHGKLALIGLSLGAAAAATGYLIGRAKAGDRNTTVTNNITFSPGGGTADERAMAKGTLSVIGG